MTHRKISGQSGVHRADWSSEITPGAGNGNSVTGNGNSMTDTAREDMARYAQEENAAHYTQRDSTARYAQGDTMSRYSPAEMARYSNAGADWLYQGNSGAMNPANTGMNQMNGAMTQGNNGAMNQGNNGADMESSSPLPSPENARVVRISNGQMDTSRNSTGSRNGAGSQNGMTGSQNGTGSRNGMNGGMTEAVWPDIENDLPDDVIEAPATMEEVYRGSMKALLMRNVGNYVVATFLIGTQTTVSWEGILYDVGNDYLAIYQSGRDQYIVSDLYSLKYVEFYDTRRRELCDELLREQGPVDVI